PPATTLALTFSANPAAASKEVILTATVAGQAAGSTTPAGTVTFLDGKTPLATVPLTAGVAQLRTRLAGGTHTITAQYGGFTAGAFQLSPGTAAQTLTVAEVPKLTRARPAALVAKTAPTLVLTGAHFTRQAVVLLGGLALKPAFVSASQLRVKVPLYLPAAKGRHLPRRYTLTAGKAVSLVVLTPGVGKSAALHLHVRKAP